MDDLISRAAAIDELDKGAWGVEWDKALAKAMLENLPSAQPDTGTWQDRYGMFACSECGREYIQRHHYCPHCGTKMKED